MSSYHKPARVNKLFRLFISKINEPESSEYIISICNAIIRIDFCTKYILHELMNIYFKRFCNYVNEDYVEMTRALKIILSELNKEDYEVLEPILLDDLECFDVNNLEYVIELFCSIEENYELSEHQKYIIIKAEMYFTLYERSNYETILSLDDANHYGECFGDISRFDNIVEDVLDNYDRLENKFLSREVIMNIWGNYRNRLRLLSQFYKFTDDTFNDSSVSRKIIASYSSDLITDETNNDFSLMNICADWINQQLSKISEKAHKNFGKFQFVDESSYIILTGTTAFRLQHCVEESENLIKLYEEEYNKLKRNSLILKSKRIK